jgi:hypothetical protein
MCGGEARPLAGWAKLWKEIAASGVFPGRPPIDLVTEAQLAALPAAVRSYMRFCGVSASQPKDWAFCIGWRGRFRLAANRPWMPIEAVQYDLRFPVARIFHMKARMKGILPVLARDTYANGRGHMLAKVADLVTVADGTGPELDQSELVTWLNDCILFAPSMLLGSATRWSQVDERAFNVSFSDHRCTVTARVSIDERGAPVNFETTDRFLNDPDDPTHPLIRAGWSTPVESWQRIGSRDYPARANATWHLASGEYTYAEFELLPRALAFDFEPVTSGEFPNVSRTRETRL